MYQRVTGELIKVCEYFSREIWWQDNTFCCKMLNLLHLYVKFTDDSHANTPMLFQSKNPTDRRRWEHAAKTVAPLGCDIFCGVETHRLARGHGAEGAEAVGVCDHHGRGEAWRVGVLGGLLLVRIHCKGNVREIIRLQNLNLFPYCRKWD